MKLRLTFLFILLKNCLPNGLDPSCPRSCVCVDNSSVKCGQGSAATVSSFNWSRPIASIEFGHWLDSIFNLSVFDNHVRLEQLLVVRSEAVRLIVPTDCHLPLLSNLSITNGKLTTIDAVGLASCAPTLRALNLNGNCLSNADFSQLIHLTSISLSGNNFAHVPPLSQSVQFLNVSNNRIASAGQQNLSSLYKLIAVDLSFNQLVRLSGDPFANLSSLKILHLSTNRIGTVSKDVFTGLRSLRHLDLARNRIVHFASVMPQPCLLETLIFDENPLEYVPRLRCSSMRSLRLAKTHISFVNVTNFQSLPQLKLLDVGGSSSLQSFVGDLKNGLASLEYLNLSWCALQFLPVDFLANCSLRRLQADGNNWNCDCRLLWTLSMPEKVDLVSKEIANCLSNSSVMEQLRQNCSSIGVAERSGRIQKIRLASAAYVRCGEYGYPLPSVLWDVFQNDHEATFEPVCSWDADAQVVVRYSDYSFLQCLPGGGLRLLATSMEHGVPLRCRVRNKHGSAWSLIMIQFDFSFWYDIKVNSFLCAAAVLAALIVLNIIYCAVRRIVAWRVTRMERTGVVRRTLEAMERYRQRQLDALYDMYTNRMQTVVDNYHQQLDQIKKSYMQQSDRFRDYRTAQMESVSQHLDSLYGSYAQQVTRVRDYGSRRLDHVWESYQKQLNRLRSFTVTQRWRMMRQYRLKQKYFSKLLEAFYSDSTKSGEEYRIIDPRSLQLPEWTMEELTGIPMEPLMAKSAETAVESEAGSSNALQTKPPKEDTKEKEEK